jgi:hypothetical protein
MLDESLGPPIRQIRCGCLRIQRWGTSTGYAVFLQAKIALAEFEKLERQKRGPTPGGGRTGLVGTANAPGAEHEHGPHGQHSVLICSGTPAVVHRREAAEDRR